MAPPPAGQEVNPRARKASGLRALAALIALAALACLGFLGALPHGNAVQNGQPASTDMAQVRIFENGRFLGGGTVVAPNWVLTAGHLFQRTDSSAYSLAFGVVDAREDPDDQSSLRSIDRIVLHPRLADIALVHFAQPLPSTLHTPRLAQAAPERFSPVRLYGWAPSTNLLSRAMGVVLDPVASENAASLRELLPLFAADFPAGIEPMVTTAPVQGGDSGSGLFNRNNVLLAVHSARATYRYVNRSGTLVGTGFTSSFEAPVWYFREWINQVISGEGPSEPHPPHDELKRRRLPQVPVAAGPPMTPPPQTLSSAVPAWPVATLTPETGTQGLVTVACPTVKGVANTCTQEIKGQLKKTIGNDDPVRIRVGPSGRQVIAWCRSTSSLATSAEPVPVVRVSFSNTDTAVPSNPPPTGYGWYDVDPARVHVDDTAFDPSGLAGC